MYYHLQRNAYFLCHIHLILSIYGHHQVCVSPAKIVSLYGPFCHTSILDVNFILMCEVNFLNNYLFIDIIKSSLKVN
jgi:hypothetical protein